MGLLILELSIGNNHMSCQFPSFIRAIGHTTNMREANELPMLIAEEYSFAIKKRQYLYSKFHDNIKKGGTSRNGALFEAIIYLVMNNIYGLDVEPKETKKGGGPDFECKSKNGQFILEATHFDEGTISSKSGIVEKPRRRSNRAQSFSPIFFSKINEKLQEKQRQLSPHSQQHSCVLAIGNFHPAGTILFKRNFIQEYLNIDVSDKSRKSLFYVRNNDEYKCRNQFVSSILFVNIDSLSIRLLGLINPFAYPIFNTALLSDIPFCRITRWPPEEISFNYFSTEPVWSLPDDFKTIDFIEFLKSQK